jgi:apolipoprotein N-acyltransferase
MYQSATESSRKERWSTLARLISEQMPSRVEVGFGFLTAALLILSFPNFDLWPLAWVGLVPLFIVIVRRPGVIPSFVTGWIAGAVFFYGTCYWLTYAMIRYGHIPAPIAYLLLVPLTIAVGIFPGIASAILARCVSRWGPRAILFAAFVWPAVEWIRFEITGQLWNAVGYSQTFAFSRGQTAPLIQAAAWGGVYAVSMLIAGFSASIVLLLTDTKTESRAFAVTMLAVVIVVLAVSMFEGRSRFEKAGTESLQAPSADIIAIQPNVPMTPPASLAASAELIQRHLQLSETGLAKVASVSADVPAPPRIVIWPESPMNFEYSEDNEFREFVGEFSRSHNASIIFNSQEPSGIGYANSAIMLDSGGRIVQRYDKIQLLPFGEYVPVPRWIPGAQLIPTMVGDFIPGSSFPQMPLGSAGKAGIFICFESAFPSIARTFVKNGSDVLINISNDGYLGPTAVMRQHLANAIFRAVENNRSVVRVTNTGITTLITPGGVALDQTNGFEPAVRTWRLPLSRSEMTFYTEYGDLVVWICAVLTALVVGLSFTKALSRKSAKISKVG